MRRCMGKSHQTIQNRKSFFLSLTGIVVLAKSKAHETRVIGTLMPRADKILHYWSDVLLV